MPSLQEKLDLCVWVENLPKREKLHDYVEVLNACAIKYGNEQSALSLVLDYFVDGFRRTMARQLINFRESGPDVRLIPDPGVLNEMFESTLKAVLLKMWTYANEHYQRYRGADFFSGVNITDEALMEFFSAPNPQEPENES
jgi:hypothetical protein